MLRPLPSILVCLALALSGELLARPAASCTEAPIGDVVLGPPMSIGDTATGSYSVAGADCDVSAGGSVFVGRTAGGVGSFAVSDGAAFGASLLYVGVSGVGGATFEGGAHVTSTSTLTLGAGDLTDPSAPGARGDVLVDGSGTLVELGTGVTVGLREPALLTVSGGARIQAQQGLNISGLSGTPGGDGEVIIRGVGSTIQTALGSSGDSRVGYTASGSLTVDQGGRLEVRNLWVAQGGDGTVVLDSGGHIEADAVSVAGVDSHTASFGIRGGATVAASTLSLASVASSSVDMTIGGAGSELTAADVSAINHIGRGGRATLRIEDGGAARFSGDLYLGQAAGTGGGGTIQVVGAGSELVADEIRLSDDAVSSGAGLLELDGGTVTASRVRLLGRVGHKGALSGSGLIVGDLSVERGWLTVGVAPRRLEVDGNASIAWGVHLEVAGPGAGEYDRLDVSGDVDVTGLVEIDFIGGYQPRVGDRFDVIVAAGALTYDPVAETITGLILPPEAELVTTVLADRVRFQVVPEPTALLSQAAAMLGLVLIRRRSRLEGRPARPHSRHRAHR